MPLHVERMPLSWLCEDATGRAVSVARRVWGADYGSVQWRIESDGSDLVLIDVPGGRIHTRYPGDPAYASPWGGEGAERLRQVAESYETDSFNAAQPDPRMEASR